MNYNRALIGCLFLFLSFAAMAQQKPGETQQGEKVELLPGAESLEGGIYKGEEVIKIIGNVAFKQKDAFLYCDSAYQYRSRNAIEAFSNVRITQGDTVTITGDRVTYDGDKRLAKVIGNVVMQDPRMTLRTPKLDYNLTTRQAFYTEGGTITDANNNLQSRIGNYNTVSKIFTFQQNVILNTPDYNITAENLRYNTVSKIAFFQGPTYIRGQQGNLYAENGTYNTITKVSNFKKNAKIETNDYLIGGDNLFYDENTEYGRATGHVTMRSKTEDVVIRGEVAHYWRRRGLSKVFGSPLMETIMDGDTLYMSADTLVSVESKIDTVGGMLYAFHDVKIFKNDLQGKCDSLLYNMKDSVIYMHRKPALWSEKSQMTGKRIEMRLQNKKIHTMYMDTDAFIISEDTLRNYNQIKGRDMTAFFKEGKIRRVNVNGNGQSIYYALEGDTALTGMNKAICSNMILMFEASKLQTISFITNPDASFIPPHEIVQAETKLPGFTWMITEKPDKNDVFQKRVPRPKAKAQPKNTARKPAPAKAPATKKTTRPAAPKKK